MVALKILAIIGIILGTLIALVVLPVISRVLKKTNKTMAQRAREVSKEVNTSIAGLDEAQVQIQAMEAATAAVQQSVAAANKAAGQAVAFLESRTFQLGVPALLWFLLFAIALPRGLRLTTTRKKRRVIPPPSWEAADEGSRAQ